MIYKRFTLFSTLVGIDVNSLTHQQRSRDVPFAHLVERHAELHPETEMETIVKRVLFTLSCTFIYIRGCGNVGCTGPGFTQPNKREKSAQLSRREDVWAFLK